MLSYPVFALLIACLVTISGTQANATSSLNDVAGDWQEVGHRCVGETNFKPRDNTYATKYFSIRSDATYTHHVDMHQWPGCEFVASEGTIDWTANGGQVDAIAKVIKTSDCQTNTNSPLVDDFSPKLKPAMLHLRLDTIEGATYMIISGNPVYVDDSCGVNNRVVERVYGQKQSLSQ